MGSDSVPWALVLSHGCWSHPMGVAVPKAIWALTKALAAECLESLKKVRIPPSSTVQEELQFFLGRRTGVTQWDSTAPSHCWTPVSRMFLPEPLPSVHCLGPVKHPGFFKAFKLESKGRGVKIASCFPWCWGEGRLGAPLLLLAARCW